MVLCDSDETDQSIHYKKIAIMNHIEKKHKSIGFSDIYYFDDDSESSPFA